MTVVFSHHGQIQIQSADTSTTGKQDLCECAIKTPLKCIGFLRLYIVACDQTGAPLQIRI